MADNNEKDLPGLPEQGWWLVRELERLSTSLDDLKHQNREDHNRVVTELSQVKEEIGALKVKASFYGAISGLGAGLAIFLAQILGHGGGGVPKP